MDDRFEVIDAFVDGERVDVPALKRALSETDGLDYFVDAWLLREGVQDEMALESIPHAGVRRWPERGWLLAVAASVVCLIGGYLAGSRSGDPRDVAGSNAPPAAEASVPQTPSFPVPSPTRAIPVEFSADSSGASGGD